MTKARRRLRSSIASNETPIDFTPLIDCVFLLLIFFILTTRFDQEEKALAALLSDGGPVAQDQPIPKPVVHLALVPAGYPANASEVELQAWARTWRERGGSGAVEVRIGGEAPILVERDSLEDSQGAGLEALHVRLAEQLALREAGATSRKEAPSVEIHCFSGLPWMWAATAFDGVRAYERDRFASVVGVDRNLDEVREVRFSQPPVRRISSKEEGSELYGLLRLR